MGYTNSTQMAKFATNTGVTDTVDAALGGVSPVGHYYRFDGPDVKTLLTSFDSGGQAGGPSDKGGAVHAAFVGASVTVNGVTYRGSDDLMVPYYNTSQRALISSNDLLVLKDAYGYTITDPNAFGTEYDTLDSNGLLRISTPGSGNNTITVTSSGSVVDISMTLGTPVAGADPSTIFTEFKRVDIIGIPSVVDLDLHPRWK